LSLLTFNIEVDGLVHGGCEAGMFHSAEDSQAVLLIISEAKKILSLSIRGCEAGMFHSAEDSQAVLLIISEAKKNLIIGY
jgi:hypothetical protein